VERQIHRNTDAEANSNAHPETVNNQAYCTTCSEADGDPLTACIFVLFRLSFFYPFFIVHVLSHISPPYLKEIMIMSHWAQGKVHGYICFGIKCVYRNPFNFARL